MVERLDFTSEHLMHHPLTTTSKMDPILIMTMMTCTKRQLLFNCSGNLSPDFCAGGRSVCDGGAPRLHVKAPDAAAAALRPAGAV